MRTTLISRQVSPTVAKRKIDSENRAVQNLWEAENMFTHVAITPVCVVCGANVAVIKECALRRRYETKHQEQPEKNPECRVVTF